MFLAPRGYYDLPGWLCLSLKESCSSWSVSALFDNYKSAVTSRTSSKMLVKNSEMFHNFHNYEPNTQFLILIMAVLGNSLLTVCFFLSMSFPSIWCILATILFPNRFISKLSFVTWTSWIKWFYTIVFSTAVFRWKQTKPCCLSVCFWEINHTDCMTSLVNVMLLVFPSMLLSSNWRTSKRGSIEDKWRRKHARKFFFSVLSNGCF